MDPENKSTLFKDVIVKFIGMVPLPVISTLQNHGATVSNLLGDYTTHCIVGEEPCESEIDEATDLYDIPIVTARWVSLCVYCNKQLPTKPFLYKSVSLFSSVTACVSRLKKRDVLRLWALVTYHGGEFLPCLNYKVTHLVVGRPGGRKYEFITKNNKSVKIVTPDWVTASLEAGRLLNEIDFHPRLLIKEPLECNTSFITGFADDCMIDQPSSTVSEELLDILKSKMPWNELVVPDIDVNSPTSSVSNEITETNEAFRNGDSVSTLTPEDVIMNECKSTELKDCEMQLEDTKENTNVNSNSMDWAGALVTENKDSRSLIYSDLKKHMEDLSERFKNEKMWLVLNPGVPLAFLSLESLSLLERNHMAELKLQENFLNSNLVNSFSPIDWLELKTKHLALFANQYKEIDNLTKDKIVKEEEPKTVGDPLPQTPLVNDVEMVSPARLGRRRSLVLIDPDKRALLNSMSPEEKDTYLKKLQSQQQAQILTPRHSTSQNKKVVNRAVKKCTWDILGTPRKKSETMKDLTKDSVACTKFVQLPTSIPATPQKTFKTSRVREISSEYVIQETESEIPRDIFLIGCVFMIVDYSVTRELWAKLVVGYGGKYVENYCDQITHIVAQSQSHPSVQRGLHEGKRCVSGRWLSEVLTNQHIVLPCVAMHFPFRFSQKPATHLSICYSGFEGMDRSRVKNMIEATGATATSVYTPHSDVLVCRQPRGEKYNKAIELNKLVVNVRWLNEMLLGNPPELSEIHLTDRYTQFDETNPFVIDFPLVERLMEPWKVPIKVSPNDISRALLNDPENPRTKRRKVWEGESNRKIKLIPEI